MDIIYRILNEFLSLTLAVFPYFILGSLFGASLETYMKSEWILKYLNRGRLSIVNASLLGAILPGCACAMMPMAQGLKARGASLGTVSAFILVSPLLSPQTVILTYGMLGMEFTLARIIFSLMGATGLGFFFNYLEQRKIKGFQLQKHAWDGDGEIIVASEKKRFWPSFLQITKDLGRYFLLGMLIAATMTVFIPQDMIPKYIGSSGILAYLAAAVVGIPMYVCEGEEVPLTLALLKLGLGSGPSLTFLLGAVGTCIPTMVMAQKIIGKWPACVYILFWFVFTIGAGFLFNFFN